MKQKKFKIFKCQYYNNEQNKKTLAFKSYNLKFECKILSSIDNVKKKIKFEKSNRFSSKIQCDIKFLLSIFIKLYWYNYSKYKSCKFNVDLSNV